MPLESNYSNQATVLADDVTSPVLVSGFILTSAEQGVTNLGWTANTEEDLAGYRVYRKEPEETDFTLLIDLADPSAVAHADNTVIEGTTYDYAVAAYDGVGNEGQKAELLSVNTVPSIPLNLNAVAEDSKITLTWDSVKNDQDTKLNENLAGYNIYRSETDGTGYEVIGTVGAEATSYEDSDITVGSTYFYVITSFDNSVDA